MALLLSSRRSSAQWNKVWTLTRETQRFRAGKTAASDKCWAKTGFRVKDERKVAILLKVKVGMSICWRF
jgi:hypothetical protein